jgi:amino acid transporter
VSKALARDRVGVPAVWYYMMSGVAPLTVAAGVITSAYAVTGLTGLPAAFIAVALVLALFVPGYVAMSRHITNAGAFYAFISRGLGKRLGVAAAFVALLAYSLLQVGLYGALGPSAAQQASAHLGLNAPWWTWALAAWALVTILGQLKVDITGKVLGVLLTAEVIVIIAETVAGLLHPAGGQVSFGPLSPSSLGSAGWGMLGVLAVICGLGFVGFEQATVLSEETRNPRRTIPRATYLAVGVITVIYAGASWAQAEYAGPSRVVAAARAEGPGLMFGLGGTGILSQAAQWLFLTSLFAAALAFHNTVYRYMFSAARENVLPAFLARTGNGGVPRAASLTQSATGLAVITIYALGGWAPMTSLFFWLGTTGGFGVLILLAITSAAVIRFFDQDRHAASHESVWARMTAPALSFISLTAAVALAVMHYATLLGVAPGSPAAWILPASFGAVAVAGLGWAAILRVRRPQTWATIGLGPDAVTGHLAARPGVLS